LLVLLDPGYGPLMKTKSHTFTSAMALCAAAVLSFTFVDSARAVIIPDINPGPIVKPINTRPWIESLPPIAPPVEVGTYNGTVMD
jgi:hypothetical protein